jgi:putative endonuclease
VSKPAERSTLSDGLAAERNACLYLEDRGLALIARNFRSRFGEIDLVMRDGETIVFVEVRRRRSEAFGTPAETVDGRKQSRLRATAELWLQQNPSQSKNPCRFDIVAITDHARGPVVQWLRDAF